MKPPVSSCNLAQAFEMFDALGQRFDVAEHHGGGAAAAELVPDAVHFEPIVGHDFAACNGVADAIDEDFAATAREAAEAGGLQAFEYRAERQLRDFGEVIDFRRAEAVDVQLSESDL